MVMYMGEALPHGARDHIEGRLGIPVLSRYNAVEAFKIGFFCEHRTGFHVHEDLCHVRIVGPDGRTAPPGVAGQIVISNLVNRASILLNYPIGDTASLSDERCPCGRTFKLLSELEGRVEDIVVTADGRSVHPRAIWETLKTEDDVLQYQLDATRARTLRARARHARRARVPPRAGPRAPASRTAAGAGRGGRRDPPRAPRSAGRAGSSARSRRCAR
jgi:phenylacetate-CoA ligase